MFCGLFTDKRVLGYKKVSLDNIKSGASKIIMLMENKDATNWLRNQDAAGARWHFEVVAGEPKGDPARLGGAIGDIGFHWGPELSLGINKKLTEQHIQNMKPEEQRFALARPFSGHPGLVVAAFADGHVDTINDDIDQRVYWEMCEPHSDNEHDHPHP